MPRQKSIVIEVMIPEDPKNDALENHLFEQAQHICWQHGIESYSVQHSRREFTGQTVAESLKIQTNLGPAPKPAGQQGG